MRQLTKEEAVAFAESKVWEKWTDDQIVRLQLYQRRLCVPFGRFHKAVEEVFGRSVWTHEFAGEAGFIEMQQEYEKRRPAPSFEEIAGMLPKDRTIILGISGDLS